MTEYDDDVRDPGMWVTPFPSQSPEEYLPELVALRRLTTRLHPRPGDPGARDSSLGGPMLWPIGTPLPTCTEDHSDDGDDGPVPLIPVIQLFRRDMPRLASVGWPDGVDVLRVLWCPREHETPYWWPLPSIFWHTEADLDAGSTTLPGARVVDETLHPHACVLHPEPDVIEYTIWDAPQGFWPPLRQRGKAFEEATGLRFGSHLTVAPGTKVGGWPSWHQPPHWPVCDCGGQAEYLLSIQSYEFDGSESIRWTPLHDQDVVSQFYRDRSSVSFEVLEKIRNPHGLQIGRSGGLHIFICMKCPGSKLYHWADDS